MPPKRGGGRGRARGRGRQVSFAAPPSKSGPPGTTPPTPVPASSKDDLLDDDDEFEKQLEAATTQSNLTTMYDRTERKALRSETEGSTKLKKFDGPEMDARTRKEVAKREADDSLLSGYEQVMGYTIEPFHTKNDERCGKVEDGFFVRTGRDDEEDKDQWLAELAEQAEQGASPIVERKSHAMLLEEAFESGDAGRKAVDACENLRQLIALLRDNETIPRLLRRLAPPPSQRGRKNAQGARRRPNDELDARRNAKRRRIASRSLEEDEGVGGEELAVAGEEGASAKVGETGESGAAAPQEILPASEEAPTGVRDTSSTSQVEGGVPPESSPSSVPPAAGEVPAGPQQEIAGSSEKDGAVVMDPPTPTADGEDPPGSCPNSSAPPVSGDVPTGSQQETAGSSGDAQNKGGAVPMDTSPPTADPESCANSSAPPVTGVTEQTRQQQQTTAMDDDTNNKVPSTPLPVAVGGIVSSSDSRGGRGVSARRRAQMEAQAQAARHGESGGGGAVVFSDVVERVDQLAAVGHGDIYSMRKEDLVALLNEKLAAEAAKSPPSMADLLSSITTATPLPDPPVGPAEESSGSSGPF